MKEQKKKEQTEQKKRYQKPLLTKHTKLTDAAASSISGELGCTRF